MRYLFCLLMFSLLFNFLNAQDIYKSKKNQFTAFGSIPTWVGIAAGWNKSLPVFYFYDSDKHKGHAQFVADSLEAGMTFHRFKEQVRNYSTRKYLPFFLFDLRGHPIVINNKKYTWALRLEDYRYEDSQQQMIETTLRLLNTVSGFIARSTGYESKGIIILATYEKSKPNTSIAPILKEKGFPYMTVSQLIKYTLSKKITILNPGKAIGYLRYIPADKEEETRPAKHDIVIYEKLPVRVPPVGGIITLEPQTPLSHINLLAQNRGTINLYTTDLKYIPGIDTLIGKLVKIECTGDKIDIQKIDEDEADLFWSSHNLKIKIPDPDLSVVDIINLDTVSNLNNVKFIGSKAMNYAFIQQLYPQYVRSGYAIPIVHYFNTLINCGANKLIARLLEKKQNITNEERNKELALIRESISNAALDKTLLEKSCELLSAKFPETRIRLRSSTNCEDLPGFNGAGLYISKGFRTNETMKVLEKKILEIYASIWTPLAFEEREYYFIDHSKAGMAILINEAFENEYANGVVVTIPGKDGCSLLINTQIGDNMVTNPKTSQLPEAIFFKTFADSNYNVKSQSDIHDVFLHQGMESRLMELKDVCINIHNYLLNKLNIRERNRYGVDIEFRLMEEGNKLKLYIKQARLLGTTNLE
jgi:hypothetical protein